MESKNIIGLLKTDKNGVEIKTGDIVEVKNAYFKNDNGIYFVDNTPGDISWCGRDYSLKKMCKNGKLSTATHNIAFWPLSAFTSNRQKNADCKAWNEQHATIEIIYNIDNAQVIEHFKQNAERLENQIKRQKWDFGENHEVTLKSIETRNHYLSVADRLSKTEGPEQPEVEEVKEVIETAQIEIIEESQPEVIVIERKYFPINESLAKTSQTMWSFYDYKTGSATESYKAEVEKAYTLAEKVAAAKPDRLGEALSLAERFSKKYAEWINKGYSIEMMCPSVIICGAGNFPVKKKEKQNIARDNHMKGIEYINGYLEKIESILYSTEVIRSDDKNAVQKIKDKIATLETCPDPYRNNKAEIRRLKERLLILSPDEMKQGKEITINGTPATFESIVEIFNNSIPKKSRFSDNEDKFYLNIPLIFSDGKRKYNEFLSNEVNEDNTLLSTYGNRDNGYKTIWKPLTNELKFMLIINKISGSGNKAVMYSILKDLIKKEEPEQEETIKEIEENLPFKTVKNNDLMRLQLLFDGKPSEEIRTILKSNGFRWSPSQKAWKRLLNDNALYSLKRVSETIIRIA